MIRFDLLARFVGRAAANKASPAEPLRLLRRDASRLYRVQMVDRDVAGVVQERSCTRRHDVVVLAQRATQVRDDGFTQ